MAGLAPDEIPVPGVFSMLLIKNPFHTRSCQPLTLVQYWQQLVLRSANYSSPAIFEAL